MNASCCSLRLISRIRNVVLSTTPKISTTKKMMPKTSSATSRQLSIIQPTFNATASATRHAPSVMKNATDFLRRALTRMAYDSNQDDSNQSVATAVNLWPETFFGKRTFRVTNRPSHNNPAVPDCKPEITVNDLGVIVCNDQPATPVDKAQIRISPARSLVHTLPRK